MPTSVWPFTVSWGRYEKVHEETNGEKRRLWQRHPFSAVSAPIPIPRRDDPLPVWSPDPDRPDIFVRGIVRWVRGSPVISLFLVNGQTARKRDKDEAWLFQSTLSVAAPDGGAIFVRREFDRDRSRLDPVQLDETLRLELAYRHTAEFAAGHGVAVHATPLGSDPGRASRIDTVVIPRHEVPRTDARSDIPGAVLDMATLADAPDAAALTAMLSPIAADYERWIDGQEAMASADPEMVKRYEPEVRGLIADARRALARIRDGIATLRDDAQAFQAFRFANRAMALQRTRSAFADARRHREKVGGEAVTVESFDIPGNRTWRPFQLAFILVNLPSTTDLHHPERSHPEDAVCDLLWFPTGGGKTEAYLGLAAYAMALRRLQGTVAGHDGEAGVAVLMRYTLRLLTLQQFQRAATLICACEVIRRDSIGRGENAGRGLWGREPFRIGLWVGMKTTPNRIDQAEEAIKQARSTQTGRPNFGYGSPQQLTSCPWCGSPLALSRDFRAERFEKGRARVITTCSDKLGTCDFSAAKSPDEGVPAMVVDEEIYRRLPTLLIATVDKFAQLTWKGETQVLFGRVDRWCSRHGYWNPSIDDTATHQRSGGLPAAASQSVPRLRPPDLIIQDELHLISGPLGTLVGLYETAVDKLCTWTVDGRTVRPKVVASTATVRQAADQVKSLFLRKVAVFPPQGLDARDNFFAIQRDPEDAAGRLYLGICAPGRRLKKILIRVYTALMSAAQTVYERDGCGVDADPWMTLVGYFNSMRELGGMRRLVDDDIRQALRDMHKRGLTRRRKPVLEELTSRKRATEIPELLDRMGLSFGPPEEKPGARGYPLDVLLATNMVSVGVDVSRLGLMVVAGQPKTTAEYIQASSRVGRQFPGLVCTVYNWVRPRDLSHYESFEHYHATFYRHVEGLSITPFAPRAVDRGLTGVLVALIRNLGFELNAEDRAAALSLTHADVQAAIATILDREQAVAPDHARVVDLRVEIEARLKEWLREADVTGRSITYSRPADLKVPLLKKPGAERWDLMTCPNSLREVEPSTPLVLTTAPLFDEAGVAGEAKPEPEAAHEPA